MIQEIFNVLAVNLASSPLALFILALFSAVILGDIAIITLIIIAMGLDISTKAIILGGIVGFFLGDIIWYFFGPKFINLIKKGKTLKKHYTSIAFFINKVFNKQFLLGLSTIKFLGGTGIVTSFYLSDKKIKFSKFLRYDIIANLGLIIFVVLFSWLAGKGFILLKTIKDIKWAIAALLILILAFHLLQKKINKKIENFMEKI